MNEITATSDLASIGLGAPGARSGVESSEDTFLTLMLTQMQNQDPFEPMENGEFLSQLASFETAAGIQELQTAMFSMAEAMIAGQSLEAASLVDKSVLAASTTGALPDGGSIRGAVELPASASGVVVEISDAAGQLVATMDLGSRPAGRATFEWDGLDADGNPLPPGNYSIAAHTNIDGESQAASTLIANEVESVLLAGVGGEITLNLADGTQLPFSRVLEIM